MKTKPNGPNHITPEMVRQGRAAVVAGKSLKEAAALVGVKASALGYHLRGGKSVYYRTRTWVPLLKSAHQRIGLNRHRDAAELLRLAAAELEAHATN